jgi:hypothetical protein
MRDVGDTACRVRERVNAAAESVADAIQLHPDRNSNANCYADSATATHPHLATDGTAH